MKRIYVSLVLAFLLAGLTSAADDPFCGKWKLNKEKSKLTGEQMKIEDLGANKFKWTFGDDSETITADGTDQMGHFGTTSSLIAAGANNWKMVIKKDGRVISSMTHSVSADGKTQTIKGTDFKPDGTTSDFTETMTRIGSGSGLAGTWESTDVKFTSPDEWEISAYEGDGLTFTTAAYKDTLSMKFDGKDYEEKGPDVPAGSMSSGKRMNPRLLLVTDKIKTQVMDTTSFELSTDGKMLTVTVRETGQPKAQTYVYDRM